MPVELELRVTYAETTAFLRRLEAHGRLVRVAALRLERPRRLGARVVLEGRAAVLTYRVPGEETGRAARTPAERKRG